MKLTKPSVGLLAYLISSKMFFLFLMVEMSVASMLAHSSSICSAAASRLSALPAPGDAVKPTTCFTAKYTEDDNNHRLLMNYKGRHSTERKTFLLCRCCLPVFRDQIQQAQVKQISRNIATHGCHGHFNQYSPNLKRPIKTLLNLSPKRRGKNIAFGHYWDLEIY